MNGSETPPNYWNSEYSNKIIKSEHIFNKIYDNCRKTFDKG
jgi:hypothetical protein